MNNLPSLSDIENILRENPAARAQVSRKGVFNSASLPDALRLKTEAIELRKQLVQNKASLSDYAARKAASQKQISDGQKTLDALKTCRAKTSPAKVTPKASTAAPAPSRFADASDPYLHQAATHRSSPAADRAEAINELNRRGATVSPEGIISRSIRGGRAAKNS